MKPSTLRHPVAVLRQICGLYQKEFAELVGCSRIYIQKIEQTPAHGGQKLSDALAQRIAHETGVSIKWLLNGDPAAPPIATNGTRYTLETFERARCKGPKLIDRIMVPVFTLYYYGLIRGILRSALKKGDAELAAYRISSELEKISKQFGFEIPPLEDKKSLIENLYPLIEKDLIEAMHGVREFEANERPKKRQRSRGRQKA